MFKQDVLLIFSDFAASNDFVIDVFDEDVIYLYRKDLSIFITSDSRENEVYVDFDLRCNSSDTGTVKFPLLLNLVSVYQHLGMLMKPVSKTASLKEKLLIKYNDLKTAWNVINSHGDLLSRLCLMLIKDQKALQGKQDEELLSEVCRRAHALFKQKDYNQVVHLLIPYKEKLSTFFFKILEYSQKAGIS